MKAERRHELKQNSLVRSLQQLPTAGKQYQAQILLVVVLIGLVIVLVRYRVNQAAEKLGDAQQALAIAGDDYRQLKNLTPEPGRQELMAVQAREGYYADGVKEADMVLETAPDNQSAMKAQALLDKGDLNFDMANYPELAGAATQPMLRPPEPPEALLGSAQDAYQQVLANHAEQKFAVTAAHFGLAAVAEDRAAGSGNGGAADWDAAKEQYQAVIDSDAPQMYKDLATERLRLLAQIRHPALMNVVPSNVTSLPGEITPMGPAIAAPASRPSKGAKAR